MLQEDQARKTSPSEVTDAQWALGAPLLPPATSSPRGGRPRQDDLREGLHTIREVHRSGWQWQMLPHDLLPKRTGYEYCAPWRDDRTWTNIVTALRDQTRVAAGREPTPRAVGSASQAVQPPESGGAERGDDGGKPLKGRTRHLVVETLGLLVAVFITRAGLAEGRAASQLLARLTVTACPRLETLCGETT